HFRERVVPHPFLLVLRPLVNFAETLATHRSPGDRVWTTYQMLLVGSVFALTHPGSRAGLADALWRRAREQEPVFVTTLLAAGWFVPEAHELWRQGCGREKLRFLAGRMRHPFSTFAFHTALSVHRREWEWLLSGPFATFMAKSGA